MSANKIQAIIWDYDGTLVDTGRGNLNVTKKIVESVSGIDPNKFFALQNLENYLSANKVSKNWRELYKNEIDFNDEQTDRAGKLWTEFQLNDNTPAIFFDGIQEIIFDLAKYKQGIVSQNSKEKIVSILKKNELDPYFGSIIGYEEVDLLKQKPDPDGLVKCIDNLTGLLPGTVFFIGDHETDIQCAANTNQVFESERIDVKVMSIGVRFNSNSDVSDWSVLPDFRAERAKDILEIVNSFN